MQYTTYKITVPSNIQGKVDKARQSVALRYALKYLSEMFGGATATAGIGGWISGGDSDGGGLVMEDVYEITSYAIKRKDDALEDLARYIKASMDQESVMYTVDGQPVFV